MVFIVPRILDREGAKQKYRCPSCEGFVTIDQDKCEHCGAVFTDVTRDGMRAALRANAKQNFPYLMAAIVMVLAVILVAMVYVQAL